MAKTIETSCLSIKFPVTGVPESFGELLEIGAKAGLSEQQLLDKIIGWSVAHVVNEDGRDLIRERAETLGIPVKTKTVTYKDGTTGEEDDETIGTAFKRAAADKGLDTSAFAASLQSHFASDSLEFSIGGVRKGGSGPRLGKEVLAQAKAAIDAGKGEDVAALLQKRHADLTFVRDESGAITVESLAAAIRENKLRREREDAALLGIG